MPGSENSIVLSASAYYSALYINKITNSLLSVSVFMVAL